jgi:nucleotide-binding universal stress UspA family protein
MPLAPFVQSVLHPSDLSEASHSAFAHALAIVLFRQASLTVLHVVPEQGALDVWSDAPKVRKTLERWGVLEPGSPRSAVPDKLALRVKKLNIRSSDPLEAITARLEEKPSDLVVLATEGRQGLPRWLKPSLAERVARRSKSKTLFVPNEARGFVSPEDGKISLRRILVPVNHAPAPDEAVFYAARAAVISHEQPVEISLLHVGDQADWPELRLPEMESCNWSRIHRQGEVVERIVETAGEISADLIVMGTSGAKGVLGALRGSVTEQVLRRAPCCLLAVPDRDD